MSKVLFIILFAITLSHSQTRDNFSNKKSTLKYLKNTFCENPFSTVINFPIINKDSTKYSFIKIIKNRNQCILEYSQNNEKMEIKCDGKIMLIFDYKYEEIEIFSLTEREQKKCFFEEKINFLIEEIKESKSRNKVLVEGKMDNWRFGFEIIYNFLKKEKEILYTIDNSKKWSENLQFKNQKNKIIFYEKKTFEEKFSKLFSEENFKINAIKEKFTDWEIIDFR